MPLSSHFYERGLLHLCSQKPVFASQTLPSPYNWWKIPQLSPFANELMENWKQKKRKNNYCYSQNMNKWLHCFSCVINTSKQPSKNYYSIKECHCIERPWLKTGASVIQSTSPRVLQTEMRLSMFFPSQKSTSGT